MRSLFLLLSIALIFVLTNCSKSTSKILSSEKILELGIEPSLICSEPIKLSYGYAYSTQQLEFKYLGSGGYYLTNGRSSLLIDPFFSPYAMLPLNLKKIGTQTENVEKGLADIKDELIQTCEAIFVTHSHYDHLLDVPYVFNNFLDPSKARIYGSESTKVILNNVVDTSRIELINENITTHSQAGRWTYLADSAIRVMPIKTEHAPHHKGIFSILLYDGEALPPEKYEAYNSELAKMRVNKWKKGDVYAYLIDFMEKGKIQFRTYLLSSASCPPNGLIAEEVLIEHGIDLALLGAASFANVDNYPEGIIDHLQPEKILMVHWEDLFEPYLEEPPRFIRANNFKELIPRINQVYPWNVNGEQKLFFPYPGIEVAIYY